MINFSELLSEGENDSKDAIETGLKKQQRSQRMQMSQKRGEARGGEDKGGG